MEIGPREPNPLFAQGVFPALQIACTKSFTMGLVDVSRLCNFNEKKNRRVTYLQEAKPYPNTNHTWGLMR